MRHATRFFVLVGALVLPATLIAKGKPPMTCPPDVGAAVEAACPCAGTWKNHGQYVRCVAHERHALKKAGCFTAGVPKQMRCAARSTCGKVGAVVCCPVPPGTCTAGGTCANNPAVMCHMDADCATRPGHVTHDVASCTASGGVSDGTGTVCVSACSPSGAFLN